MKTFKRILVCLAVFAVLGFVSCDNNDGTLRVINKNVISASYISKIEVLNADGSIFAEETYDENFTSNKHADIDLPEGTYGLRITRNPGNGNTETVWPKKTDIEIIAKEITTVEFNPSDDEWLWDLEDEEDD